MRGAWSERWGRRASFTVEAALLMTVIVPVLTALLVTGFYLHDKGYLQGCAIELAAMGSNLRSWEEREARMDKTAQQRQKKGLLWTRDAALTFSVGEEESAGEAAGSFSLPPLTGLLLGGASLDMGVRWQRRLYRPAELIWQVRAAKYLAEDIFDEGTG